MATRINQMLYKGTDPVLSDVREMSDMKRRRCQCRIGSLRQGSGCEAPGEALDATSGTASRWHEKHPGQGWTAMDRFVIPGTGHSKRRVWTDIIGHILLGFLPVLLGEQLSS